MHYGNGQYGLAVDRAKCIDLLREAADLGCSAAQYQLGQFHHDGKMGLKRNKKKALKYWEKAAEGGKVDARHSLGVVEGKKGNDVAAIRHLRLSASGGFRRSMESLISAFEHGVLHHSDLSESLRRYYRSRTEMKSEGRDQHIAYLKRAGEYKAEYDL